MTLIICWQQNLFNIIYENSFHFIGCVYHNGSILRLRSWRSECCMVWLRHTWISWFVLLTCLVVALAAYVHQRHISWTSLHTAWNPSAVGRFRSPHQLCGTLCHLRFSRHLRWLCFVNDWSRRIYFRNHSLMSYSDDYVSVDLAITFVILDTLNIFLIDWLIIAVVICM